MKKFIKNIAAVFTISAVLAIAASVVSADTIRYRGEYIDYNRFVQVEAGNR